MHELEPAQAEASLDRGHWQQRVFSGVVVLLGRTGLVKAIGFAGSIILARVLFPADFGAYATVDLVLGLFTILGDIGLGGSIIQRADEPSDEDLQTIFTFQQLMVVASAVGVVVSAPFIVKFYRIGHHLVWLFDLAALALVVTSFRTIPSLRLERHLEFQKLAAAEILSAIAYQGTAVCFALLGAGPWAFGLAALAHATTASVTVYCLAPWPVRWRWNWERLRKHLRFGVYMQGANTLADLELAAAPVLIGRLAGPTALGYATWATKLAGLPRVFADVTWRVAFPTMSRLQANRKSVAEVLESTLKANMYVLGAPFVVLLLFGQPLVTFVYSARWSEAVPVLNLMIVWTILRTMVNTGVQVLYSLGRSKINFALLLGITLLSWGLAIPLVLTRGYTGWGTAMVLAELPGFAVFWFVRREVAFDWLGALLLPALPLLATYFLGRLASPYIHANSHQLSTLVLNVSLTTIVYATACLAIEWRTLRRLVKALQLLSFSTFRSALGWAKSK